MSRRAAIGGLAGLLLAAWTAGPVAAQPLPEIPTLPAVPREPTPAPKVQPPAVPPVPKLPSVPPVPKLPPYEKIPPSPRPAEDPPTPDPTPTPDTTPPGEGFFGPPPGPAPLLEVPGKPFGRPAPLPGSVEDEYQQELLAREGFRTFTWQGTNITAFPTTLLWEPGMAVQRDPRMKATLSNQRNFSGGTSLDTSIGGTQGLYRFDFPAHDIQAQTDIFGVVHTRLSPEHVTFADYRFGLPLTFKWNWWQAKIAYEHTSSHLGDRLLRAIPQPIPSWAKDELVLGLGRIWFDQLRLYVNYGYAFQLIVPGVDPSPMKRSRYDMGFEWYDRRPTGFWGTPFAAGNIEWQGSQGRKPNYTIQAGWLWRNPFTRLGQFRIFAEHYRGQSPYSINSTVREQFSGGGIAFDY